MTRIAETELKKARQSLLDLTLRNRLLNYRLSTRTIRIVDEIPSEVFDTLVLRSKTFDFRAANRNAVAGGPLIEPQDAEKRRPGTDQFREWEHRSADALQPHHRDGYLQTPYDDDALEKRLFRVYHEGRSVAEEQGYSVVYLAIGFLEWYDVNDREKPRLAPLLLVPVELERIRAGVFSRVKWTGEDVQENISLAAKLAEQGIALPAFELPDGKADVDEYLLRVRTQIAGTTGWRIIEDMTLDFFSFTKFVMYKDLDSRSWPEGAKPEHHAILETLLNPTPDSGDLSGFDENDIDLKLAAKDLHHIMDADPSQTAVIEDVKAGRNLVVQGPPGTGKSQTITNIIAEALAARKTVLFVSEKMAALEVVKKRLDGAGLGPFCLELHSRKATRKVVVDELKRALESKALSGRDTSILEEHDLLKTDLDRYASDLRSPLGAVELSPYQLFDLKQKATRHFEKVSRDQPVTPLLADAEQISTSNRAAIEKALRELTAVATLVRPVSSNPWRISGLTMMLPHESDEVRDALDAARIAMTSFRVAAEELVQAAGVTSPLSLAAADQACRAAELLLNAGAPTDSAVLLNEEWNAPSRDAEQLVARVRNLQNERRELAGLFTDGIFERDIARSLNEFRELAPKFFRILNRRYWTLKSALSSLFKSAERRRAAEIVTHMTHLEQHQRTRQSLRDDRRGSTLFGARWLADKSDVEILVRFSSWVVAFRRELLSDVLTKKAIEIASRKPEVENVRSRIEQLRAAVHAVRARVGEVLNKLYIQQIDAFGQELDETYLDEAQSVLQLWAAKTGDLFRWCQFASARAAVAGTAAAPLLTLVNSDSIEPEDLLPLFEAALAESLLRLAFRQRPSITNFIGELHEKKIARFQGIDSQLVALNRARLSQKLHAARPQLTGGASRTSAMGILQGELLRKARHMPIRKLFREAHTVIQSIKPCFLMSPLSVAQFLDPSSVRFDLVLFDEASQVRPEDALGAFLRGNQVVVMGDTRQLPPTSFFDHLVQPDDIDTDVDEEQAATIQDVESILHQCARSYPSRLLNWHYRSRHESLIAVSNREFYDNALRIYPSAIDSSEHLGLHLVLLRDSVYDRGKSATNTNRIEAQAVASAAIQHYRKWGSSKSLGVGTFNIKQQQAILEEIESALRNTPEMEEHFRRDKPEHFFVKNLETIQGDERDVILLSIAYGYGTAGKMSLNFGPLNREGGERRLNVLITRAREKCVVYSNFLASDLAVEKSSSRGLVALKTFLEYAETRRLPNDDQSHVATDSSLEESVSQFLENEGWEVRKRVGCAGFRVDIGVVDPRNSGRYLLAIECDGVKYHSSRVARDRDRLRAQILNQLGWRIHRMWSPDWYRSRAAAIRSLLDALHAALSAPADVVDAGATTSETQLESGNITALAAETHVSDANAQAMVVVRDYEICRSLRIPVSGELHLVRPADLATAVEDVVKIEGPVHIDEVVRRIRSLWSLQRAGERIKSAVHAGIGLAVRRRTIQRKGDFLASVGAPIRVRRRRGDPTARIDLISEAEIEEGVKLVLRTQFATPADDLVTQTSRVFGIMATSAVTASRIESVLAQMISRRELAYTNTGSIELVRAPSSSRV